MASAFRRTPNKDVVTDSPYAAALRMLARRELSAAQVRARLERLGHPAAAIESAIEQLKQERSLDDARVAGALARTVARVQKKGRGRVRQRLAAAGLSGEAAERAIDEAFEEVDEDAIIRLRIAQRLGDRRIVTDRRELARLYRYLIGQGFDQARVMAALRELGL